MKKDDTKIIDEMLGEEFMQTLLTDLSIQSQPPETQIEIVSKIGANIARRIVWAIIELLPPERHEEFMRLVDAGDGEGLQAFLAPYIPDQQKFAENEAIQEYDATKARAKMLMEGM